MRCGNFSDSATKRVVAQTSYTGELAHTVLLTTAKKPKFLQSDTLRWFLRRRGPVLYDNEIVYASVTQLCFSNNIKQITTVCPI